MEIEYEETVGTDGEQLQELPQEVSVTQKYKFTIAYIYRATGYALLKFMLTMILAIDEQCSSSKSFRA